MGTARGESAFCTAAAEAPAEAAEEGVAEGAAGRLGVHMYLRRSSRAALQTGKRDMSKKQQQTNKKERKRRSEYYRKSTQTCLSSGSCVASISVILMRRYGPTSPGGKNLARGVG